MDEIDATLYELIDGQWYYKGLGTDSVEEHCSKCQACAKAQETMGNGYFIPHGQMIRNPRL